MNNRIEELAIQAGLCVEYMIDDSSRDVECYVDSYGAVPSTEHINKLAELIIKASCDFLSDSNCEFEAEQLEDFWYDTQTY